MNNSTSNYAFCVLALGKKYQDFAKDLAGDLSNYAPQASLIVGTEDPKEFSQHKNVVPFEHHKQGVLHCYHDKRFVVGKALSQFNTAIQIDADTRLIQTIPDSLSWEPGITAGHMANMVEHIKKYSPERFDVVQQIATKLDLKLNETTWVGESLFVVTRDSGKEKKFIQYWGRISRYLELRGIHSGEGIAIGLAAAKAGLKISTSPSYAVINHARVHLDATDQVSKSSNQSEFVWAHLKRRVLYHYRLNLSRATALQDFVFYYQ